MYANAVVYPTIPKESMPMTSEIVLNIAKTLGFSPNTCHIVLYQNRTVDFPPHDDKPLEPDTGYFVLRMGYSRITHFEGDVQISSSEGDVYVVYPERSNIKHWVPSVTLRGQKRIMATENPHFEPVLGEFVSIALVCRCVPITHRSTYDGYEALLIPYTDWTHLQKSICPLKEVPISGIPAMIMPVTCSLSVG